VANGKLGHEYHLGIQQDICAKKKMWGTQLQKEYIMQFGNIYFNGIFQRNNIFQGKKWQ